MELEEKTVYYSRTGPSFIIVLNENID